jgi:hypothetical protein
MHFGWCSIIYQSLDDAFWYSNLLQQSFKNTRFFGYPTPELLSPTYNVYMDRQRIMISSRICTENLVLNRYKISPQMQDKYWTEGVVPVYFTGRYTGTDATRVAFWLHSTSTASIEWNLGCSSCITYLATNVDGNPDKWCYDTMWETPYPAPPSCHWGRKLKSWTIYVNTSKASLNVCTVYTFLMHW